MPRIRCRKCCPRFDVLSQHSDSISTPLRQKTSLHTGKAAWDAALATINVGKVNLGWASIGISEHAFYEAVAHANNRILYGKAVTEFPRSSNAG